MAKLTHNIEVIDYEIDLYAAACAFMTISTVNSDHEILLAIMKKRLILLKRKCKDDGKCPVRGMILVGWQAMVEQLEGLCNGQT